MKKKKKKHKKAKKTGDIIILHMCTKNHNQVQSMRYGVTQFFCHLGPICATPLVNAPENQNFEKKNKKASGDLVISSFSTCATKNTIK